MSAEKGMQAHLQSITLQGSDSCAAFPASQDSSGQPVGLTAPAAGPILHGSLGWVSALWPDKLLGRADGPLKVCFSGKPSHTRPLRFPAPHPQSLLCSMNADR